MRNKGTTNAQIDLVHALFVAFNNYFNNFVGSSMFQNRFDVFIGHFQYPFTYARDRSDFAIYIDEREFISIVDGSRRLVFILKLLILYLVIMSEIEGRSSFKSNHLALNDEFKNYFLTHTGFKISDQYGRYLFTQELASRTPFITDCFEAIKHIASSASLLYSDVYKIKPTFMPRSENERLRQERRERLDAVTARRTENSPAVNGNIKVGFCSITHKPYGVSADTFAILEMEGTRLASPYAANGYIVFEG